MPSQLTDLHRKPPYLLVGSAGIVLVIVALVLVACQFEGVFVPKARLTMIAARAGLTMDTGSKVTYNGVPIGRVTQVRQVEQDGVPKAELSLEVEPRFIDTMPANVDANIKASTVFGPKYVAFSSPKQPAPQRLSPGRIIDASSVTTEANTLFETVTSIAEKVDPIKLNATLAALAQALDGLGERFGASLVDANAILDDLNPQMPQIRDNIERLADTADTYADAAPDLLEFLRNALTTARTLNGQQADLDAALTAAVGFGNTGADIFERTAPYFVRGQADQVPTSQLLDTYSPEFFCAIRNYANMADAAGIINGSGNGYALRANSNVLGAPNPYVYPDNLPRINARGGPGGRPGCWAPITRDLWPAPYLVMDTGASIAPYNHFDLGQPLAIEYIWGRQIGENTINP